MTAARLKRLQRLERCQPRGLVWRDPFDACPGVPCRVRGGRGRQGVPAAATRARVRARGVQEMFALRLRDSDRMAERLAAEAA